MVHANLDQALREAVQTGIPVEVLDPTTNRAFFVVSAEQFRDMTARLGQDFSPRELYPTIDQVMAEDDAADPLLESYQ